MITTVLYPPRHAMAHVSLADKLEGIIGNKNMKATLLAYSLENKVGKSPSDAILETASKVSELKSILQSQSNLTDNENILLVDSFGHKAIAAYSNKESSSLFTQEKPFSNLQSFKNALAGKFGSIVETINDGNNKIIVSYHLIKNHSSNWVLLLLQPYDKFVDELALEHD
jgi:hypothetical protein